MGSRAGTGTSANNATNRPTSGATTTASAGNPTTDSSQGSRTTASATAAASNQSESGRPQPPPFNPMEMFASIFGAPGARPQDPGQMPVDLGAVIGNLMQATRVSGL